MSVTINRIAGDDVINRAERQQGVTVSGTVSAALETLTLKVLDGTGATIYSTNVQGNNGAWSVVLPGFALPADGTYTISANADFDFPDPGPATRSVVVDLTPPTVTGITISDTQLWPGDHALVTFQFSDAPVGFTVADISAGFGSISNFTQVDADTYTATLSPAGEGQGTITVGTNWTDAAGNHPASSFTSAPYDVDVRSPNPGVASFVGLDNTGAQNDVITADNTFAVTTSPGRDLNQIDISLERSVNRGAFQLYAADDHWTEVSLPDGEYRYRFRFTDEAGNTSTGNIIAVIIDKTPPVVGTLSFANLIDSGSSDTPPVTTARNFDLALSGTESGANVRYEVSPDGGASWSETSASQSDLADGTYRFHAIAEDAAGNTSISNELTVTVDNVAVPGTLGFANLIDTGPSNAQVVTTDNAFDLVLSGSEPGTLAYQVSTDNGATWSATGASQSGLADATYLFKGLFTDRAGNSATTNTIAVTLDHRAPAPGTLAFANLANGGNNGLTTDNSFDLALSGEEPGASVLYQVSTDGGASWLTTAASQSALPDGTYHYRAFVTDAAGNIASTNELMIIVAQQIAANQPPVATGFDYISNEDSVLTGTLTATDPEGAPLTYRLFEAPAHGSVVVNPDGTFRYTPNADYDGDDFFTFKANDGALDSNRAGIQVFMTAVNDAPVNTVRAAQSIEANHALVLAGFSIADVDADGGGMRVQLKAGHGLFTADAVGGVSVSGNRSSILNLTGTLDQINAALSSGHIVYTPRYDFFGDDTITMMTFDNGHSGMGGPLTDTDAVTIHVNTRVDGTAGNDSFVALPGSELIEAGAGIDSVTFGFKLTDAEIGVQSDGTTTVDGPNGSHTVMHGVEIYNFADGSVNVADGDPLVDDLYYYAHHHDVWSAHADADLHYRGFGWREGRDPNLLFDTTLYLNVNADVKAAGLDPLTHYDTIGWKQGRDTSIFFDTDAYLAANPDVKAAGVDPLAHFLTFGESEGRRSPEPLSVVTPNGFDYVYYDNHNTDVYLAGFNSNVDPFVHYETIGWKEGRNPNPWFDTKGYLSHYADVAAAGINPLDHYHQIGWKEGRDPSPDFDTKAYLAANPDVAAAHIDPLAHFLQHGFAEGRHAFADGVWGP